jgi:flagellar hook-associated protein 3 FlgL
VSTVTLDPAVQGDVLRQVDPNRTAQVNMLASDVFTGAVDVFQLAIDLKNALWKDDGAAADALIDSLDAAIDDLTESLGTIGAKTVSLENHQSRLENEELDLVNFISEIEGADMPAAVVRLQAEQTAYEAALAATGRLMQISLINYL